MLCEKNPYSFARKNLCALQEKSNCRGIFFLAKAAKTLMTLLTLANPLPTRCEAFASSAALREKGNFREIFFSPRPQRPQRRSMNIFVTTFALREKSIQLCEKKSLRFAREEQLSRDIFSRQGRKDLDDLTHPCQPLANPLRSLCVLCGFAREEQLSRDIFLAKPQRSQRSSMNILATTFHDLCFFSNDISRLMLAIARFAQKYAISQKQ